AADPGDDVLVLAYISVGEDLRTTNLTDEQMLADPRFMGDGSGPRVDPRGPDADGGTLAGVDPRGVPSPGGTGWASWYLDDNDHNGRPDRNGRFGGCFVNAGDPAWFAVMQDMLLDEPHGRAGLREILTTSHGRGLGCDGVFLDTIDTAAPNHFSPPGSENPSQFEWTAPGFLDFIRRLRQAYPSTLILQNRGLFFFDVRLPHFAFNARGLIDFVLFESLRLNSNSHEQWNPIHYPDNRYNIAPKVAAEAGRPDGFQVISMGYAEGPGIDPATLRLGSGPGRDTLVEDIHVAHGFGFRHFLTTAAVRASEFVRNVAVFTDDDPPIWSSTWNPPSVPAQPPPQRFGLQEAIPGPGSITVRWDVALDLNPVSYALYLQPGPFDLGTDPDLSGASRIVLTPTLPSDFAHRPDRYPYEAVVGGLAPGTTYHLILRAFDSRGNEEKNAVVRTAAVF
ncbi:MAG TPA: hypothetical protein VEJ18_22105, partial [Planctomycetota bacterium]|nr:hypothetical protein [Planctomycetota bacterium]